MRRLMLSVLLIPSLALPVRAAGGEGRGAARAQLAAGVSAANAAQILSARAAFAAQQADSPKDARLACWIAIASWRAVPLLQAKDPEQAKKVCKEGIVAADRAIALDPRLADAIAIKAGLQGLSLSFNPAMGPTLAPEMDEAYGRAEGLDARNPRVLLLKGMNTMHKPEFIGGGAKRAMPIFDKAIQLFTADSATSGGVDWGRADAQIWAGRCRLALKDTAQARGHYQNALALDPDNVWVSRVLLPALDATPPTKSAP